MRNPGFIDKNKKQCCEVISLVIEYLLYGDKYVPDIFEYILSKPVLFAN